MDTVLLHLFVLFLILLCLAPTNTSTSPSPAAVYFGAAVSHRSEHDRSVHGRYGPARTAASRLARRPPPTPVDDEPEAATSAVRADGERVPQSIIPLSIKMQLAKNITSFVSEHVRTKSEAERRQLRAWAAAASKAGQHRRLQNSGLIAEASRRKPTTSRKSSHELSHASDSSHAMMTELTHVDELAEQAECEPMLTVVRVPLSLNHTTLMHPECVKVRRCSDCCIDPSLQCRPTQISLVDAEVWLFLFNGSPQLDSLRSQRVPIEAHDHCQCQCRLQAKDCDLNKQEYDEKACQCRCRNEFVDSGKCTGALVWNPDQCRCTCAAGIMASARKCPHGMRFDEDQLCECVPN